MVKLKTSSDILIDIPHYSLVPKESWHWVYFTPKELASRGNGALKINIQALDKLEWVRTQIGKPLVILSAYRDPIHNQKVGGAPYSRHLQGDAFDISLRHHDVAQLVDLCKQAGFTGFGYYPTFLHVDCGRAREWHHQN